MEFNEKLQQLRKQNNMTQEQLAIKQYVSRTAVSKWESGSSHIYAVDLMSYTGQAKFNLLSRQGNRMGRYSCFSSLFQRSSCW